MVLQTTHVVVATLFFLLTKVHSQTQGCQTPSGARGQCITIRDCPFYRNLLNTSGAADLRRAICKVENNVFFVCCPQQTAVTTSPPPNQPILPNTNLLPSDCGKRDLGDRIINGENANLFDWPWIAILEGRGLSGRMLMVGGGVLISELYVLTAAQSLRNNFEFTLERVRLGEHTRTSNPDCDDSGRCAPPYQIIPVAEIIEHEDFGSPHGCKRCNDIALIRLQRRAQLNSNVKPVCLPVNLQKDLGFSQNEFESKVTLIAGWGTITSRSQGSPVVIKPDILQQIQLPIKKELCTLDLRRYPNPNMVLCAGEQGKDACRGDNGGPMVMSNQADTKIYVVGIVSEGPAVCGAHNTGGLYTNVNHYIEWILKNLRP